MVCDKCGGFVISELLEDRLWGDRLEGWKCVSCGQRGDFTGVSYGRVGEEPDRSSYSQLERNLSPVPGGVLCLGRLGRRFHRGRRGDD